MKVLFAGPRSPDHLACCVWDGLQEILGEQNVVDAVNSPWLHALSLEKLCQQQGSGERQFDFSLIIQSICGTREGRKLKANDKGEFDLLVLISSFNRDEGWEWARAWMSWLRPNGRVAYVEGWDAAWQIEKPHMPADAVFRKEISQQVQYPYDPQHLTFAAPERWFAWKEETRPYDVLFVGNPNAGHPNHLDLRWRMLSEVFRTRRHHASVIATRGIGHDKWFQLLRQSKLALCPTAADSSDSLRTYEAVACGAIPVFVGYPDYKRKPWFGGEHCISCTVDTLADHLDNALSHDLTPMRQKLREHALEHHTTAARALKVLTTLGFKKGTDF
jgi:hypothetical protein